MQVKTCPFRLSRFVTTKIIVDDRQTSHFEISAFGDKPGPLAATYTAAKAGF